MMPIFGFFDGNFSALPKRGSQLKALARAVSLYSLPKQRYLPFCVSIVFSLLAIDDVDVFCNGDTHNKSPKHHEKSKIKPCAFTDWQLTLNKKIFQNINLSSSCTYIDVKSDCNILKADVNFACQRAMMLILLEMTLNKRTCKGTECCVY